VQQRDIRDGRDERVAGEVQPRERSILLVGKIGEKPSNQGKSRYLKVNGKTQSKQKIMPADGNDTSDRKTH
jgi:hypothetical protein